MTYREIEKLILKDGWMVTRQRGSHRQYKHPEKKGLVTIAPHSWSDEVPKVTANSILQQAGLK